MHQFGHGALFCAGKSKSLRQITWLALLDPIKPVEIHAFSKQVVKVYRGQTILVDTPTHNAEAINSLAVVPQKALRMYRGHPVL